MRICTYHNFKHIFDQFLIGSYYTDIPNTNTDSFVVIKNLYVTAEAEIICKTKTTSNKSSIFLASKIDICLTLDELFNSFYFLERMNNPVNIILHTCIYNI